MRQESWYPRYTLHQCLLAERAAIQRQLHRWHHRAAHGEEMEELSTYDNHPADVATALHQRQQTAGFMWSSRRRLQQVDAALARMAAGRSGACTRCHHPIAAGRLLADAAAARCIACQRQEEQGERQHRRAGPVRPKEGWGPSAWDIVASYGNASDPVQKR